MRPGCNSLAAARLTYDTEAAAVWLDPPVEDGRPAQQVCSIHAGTLTAPLGWTVTDRRLIGVGCVEQPQTSNVEPAPSPFIEARRAARAARVPTESPAPTRVMEPLEEETPEQEPVLVQEGGRPATPAPAARSNPDPAPDKGASDPPKADTKARGKLLERAFEWTGPQHSVLTTGHDHRPRRND